MTEYGFILGIIGSLHCVGMCGPIALALPIKPGTNRVLGIVLYNAGRIVTYGFLGIFSGLLGQSLVFIGLQQYLSIAAGIALLLFLILPLLGNYSVGKFFFFQRLNTWLRAKFSILFSSGKPGNLFFIGIINGALPCGMVYVALAGSAATGSVLSAVFYMMLFGAGTIPAMFAISWFRSFLFQWKSKLQNVVPVLIAVMAITLILRGLNLGIPYLSPEFSSDKPSCCTSAVKCH